MNKILFFLLTLFTLAVVGCGTSRTYYTEYDTTDISYVVDSIVSSGTVMGQWKEWRFTLDDGRVDNFGFTALYETGDWVRYGRPNYFYYCVPDGLVDPKDIPPYAGLAYVCGRNLRKVKDAPILHRDKFDPEAYKMADKFYYNWWNERRKARQIEGKDMKDEFRKSMKKVKEKITVDAKIKAMEAFWSVCDYAYWPYGGRGVPGMRPNCSACGEECKLQCPKGKEFKNKIR